MSAMQKFQGEGLCDKHGKFHFTAYRVGANVVGKVCPECLHDGQMRAMRSNEADEEAHRIEQRSINMKRAGVLPLFLQARFDNYKPNNQAAVKNLKIMSAYATAFDHVLSQPLCKGLILTGLTGTGKTHLACATMDALMETGYSAIYASTPTLLIQLRDASMGRYETSLSNLIAMYSTPHLLVLDEYGINTTTDKDYQLLYSLIDARYQKNLPTILITNVSQENLEKELDARFLERIRGANGPVLGFNWESYRVNGK